MMYVVGKIVKTHGIHGEVKVKSETSFNRFMIGSILYIEKDTKKIPLEITSHRLHQNMDLLTFAGIEDINQALPLVGLMLYIEHNHQELNPNEYYYEDLIGINLYDEKEHLLGIVMDIRELPHGILLEANIQNKIKLIPFVDAFIQEINLEEKKIIIHTIEGLL